MLSAERMVIGRHPACDIVIDLSAVSRQHAAITTEGGAVFIEDLRSRNGTIVNGKPLTGRQRLETGDQLQICEQVLVYVSGERPRAVDADEDDAALTSQTSLFDEVVAEGDHDSMIVSQVDMGAPQDDAEGPHAEAKLRAVIDLNRAIGASLSLDEVLPRLLDGLFKIFPGAQRGFVLLADPATRRLLLRARKVRGKVQPGPLRLSLSLIDRVMQSRRAILSADAASDSRFNASESIVDCRIRSVMCVPFLRADGQVLGVIHVDSQDVLNGFVQEDLEVLAGIAGQAAQAVEQALAHDRASTRSTSTGISSWRTACSRASCRRGRLTSPATRSSTSTSRPSTWVAISSPTCRCRRDGWRSCWPTSPARACRRRS